VPVINRARDVARCRLSVEKYPDNRMMGRREIVDGMVGPLLSLVSRAYGPLCFRFCADEWFVASPSLFASGWQLHMDDLQGGLRHRAQGWGGHPELRRRQGTWS
jgi:hypothetical protein